MTDTPDPDLDEEPPKKKSKALLFGLVGAVLLGGGAFYGVFSGMIPLPFGDDGAKGEEKIAEKEAEEDHYADPATIAASFVPIEEMVISLGPETKAKHLKLQVSIEVKPGTEQDVQNISPRIVDVLNTYLRAVNQADLENPRSMTRMRAQMLRRVRLVAPEGAIRDVLIQQFLLN